MRSGLAIAVQLLAFAYALFLLVMALLGALLELPTAATLSLSLLGNALFVAAAVVFGLWLAEAYAWAGEGKHGKGWTIGSWYIPVGTIGTPHAPMLDLVERATGRPPGPMTWVWLLAWSLYWLLAFVGFVGGIVVGVDAALAGSAQSPTGATPDIPAWLLWLGVANAAVLLVAAVGLSATVRELGAHQVAPQ